MKRVLILGGSGRLSSILAEMAEKRFEEVWILTRGNHHIDKKYKHLKVDRNDRENFEKEILKAGVFWDAVFDCICMNPEHAIEDLEVLEKVTHRLVVVSTDSVYASEYKQILQGETGIFVDELEKKKVIPEYAINKRKMEKVFQKYFLKSEENKLKVTLFRPGHIFGPGFLFGCFPMASRQENLLENIKKNRNVFLVGMGCYLIHPVYGEDLGRVMLDCVENEKTYQDIFCIGGPEILENRKYYEILAELLQVPLKIQEIPVSGFLEKYPEYYGHLCHRAYDLTKLKETGITLPETTLREGLKRQMEVWKNEI